MLKKYLADNRISALSFAKKIGISNQALFKIFNNKSKNTKVWICLKIQKETGLMPYDYLDGLENLRKLKKK